MQKAERYPPRRARTEKRVTERVAKESKADTAARQKRPKPKLEPSKPGTEMDLGYLPSPVSGKQSAMYERLKTIPPPLNVNKSAQKPVGEYQSTVNIGGTKNRLPATSQTTAMPFGIIGPFADTTTTNHGTYLGTAQALELAKIEPASAQLKTKLPRLIPITAQSTIRFPHQNTPTVAPSMNADSRSTEIGSSSTTPPVSLFTASFTTFHDIEFSTTAPFIRGISQPFPSSETLGSYPQYPYSKNLNHLADGFAGTTHPGFNLQTEHIKRSTPGGDMVTYATKNTRDDEDRMNRNPYFHDGMKSMRPGDMDSVWKEKQEGMKARKKAISKSMISAPIGLVVKDERRVVSEVIIPKDSPSKGKVWSKVLKMMV
ncbi:uncharacterized protein H6S33_011468 [Morchella sextelata]|uniref:uncharacterized protein n=1 Tax=Morchella sextelata TaxID=1174677 RepID=UPI001D0548C9|nr:uncharacterized protein H6S33_011468 [Morchella sextelata]KAH0611041.1 hypothetical protein H6S33_011468 [Morchella sextelata]